MQLTQLEFLADLSSKQTKEPLEDRYGLAHKGTSVVLYRNKALRKMQFTPVTDWSGGLYISPGLSGSRSGGLIATAWAAMRHTGVQGYTDVTKAMLDTVSDLCDCIRSVPELRICGQPFMTVVAFRSVRRSFNVYQLQQILERKGWFFASLIKPAALHFAVTQQHVNGISKMKADFLSAVQELRQSPGKNNDDKAKLYGSAASVSNRGLIAHMLTDYQDVMLDAE